MAQGSAATEEEIRLRGLARRRLVGAIVMVLVAAAILPMVLEDSPRPVVRPVAVEIPGRDDLDPLAEPAPMPATAPVPPGPTPAAEAAIPASPLATPAVTSTPRPAPMPPPATPSVTPPPPTGTPPVPSGAFVVQVGAFGDADNARQMADRLRAAGMQVISDAIPRAGGNPITRVRAGPFPTRAAADSAAARLALQGIPGTVLAAP